MKSRNVVIGLLSDRIDVVVCAGAQPLGSRRIQLILEQDPEKWLRQVRESGKAILTAAHELGAAGLPARVLYRGPSACAEYVSPRARSASEAASAAVLSCADSLACPLDAAATRAMVLACDKDEQPRAHVVVAADGDDAMTALRDMVRAAGLKFASATPMDAVLMAGVAQRALDTKGGASALLYVGEARSFLVITANQSIIFARPIAAGLDAMVTSLTRPLRLANGQTVELNRETARQIIHECGFPSRSQVVHEEKELIGGHIVPLLQPVLQRFMVELRQSLRFALPEGQRDDVTLLLCGPGARTPGFSQIVTDELGVKVSADEQYQNFDYRQPTSAGSELLDALAARRAMSELALEPLAQSRSRRMRQMQRWLWTGAAAALAMIGFDAMRLHSRLAQTRKQSDALHSQNEGMQALKVTADKLLAASSAMATLENTIARESGARVCMGAVLQELSRITPSSVRLFNINFEPGSEVMLGGLSGYVVEDARNPNAAGHVLEGYMQRLGQSPLLDHVALANVQTSIVQERPAQSFDMSFDAVAAPIESLTAGDALATAAPEAGSEPHE